LWKFAEKEAYFAILNLLEMNSNDGLRHNSLRQFGRIIVEDDEIIRKLEDRFEIFHSLAVDDSYIVIASLVAYIDTVEGLHPDMVDFDLANYLHFPEASDEGPEYDYDYGQGYELPVGEA
jgi:hypothetical protein